MCKRVLEIQSTIFFNTYSRPSANISTASIGRQSGCHHIVGCFFTEVSVNRAEQTLNVASVVFAALGKLIMSSMFNGCHACCRCASAGFCSVLEQWHRLCIECHFVESVSTMRRTACRVACQSNPITCVWQIIAFTVFVVLIPVMCF